MYPDLLGADFERLPPAVRAFHQGDRPQVWAGEAQLQLGAGALAWGLRQVAGFPQSVGSVAVQVAVTPMEEAEQWDRRFGDHRTVSMQRRMGDGLRERLRAVDLGLTLTASEAGLDVAVSGGWLGGIALPALCVPVSQSRATEDDQGRYAFDVAGYWPRRRLLIRYTGWLAPIAQQ